MPINKTNKINGQQSAAVYSKNVLAIYDILVLGIANSFAWHCPTRIQLDFYNQHISNNHLDVGVGTGYYLDKCRFSAENPTIYLLDLNQNSLLAAAKRIRRYQPKTHHADILKPLTMALPTFDSIGVNYLLHCLPGDFTSKEVVFKNLSAFLNTGGVIFGATILGNQINPNFLARKFLKLYNGKGIFNNLNDSLVELELSLAKNFKKYTLQQIGCVALFSGMR